MLPLTNESIPTFTSATPRRSASLPAHRKTSPTPPMCSPTRGHIP